jgi:ribosome biogenesis protein BRX1
MRKLSITTKPPKVLLTTFLTHNRHRHLLSDLHSLLPHSRKDAKLDTKTQLHQLNELADLYNCNNVMFFEARKGKDLYIWLSKPPNGPTLKMHCQNVHTMEELNFTGNCLKGSRPILSFDATFDESPHLRVVKELLTHSFGVPQSSRKVKPFVDHVMGFTVAGGRVWIRCYQIAETEASKKKVTNGTEAEVEDNDKKSAAANALPSSKAKAGETSVSLVEIGPRLVLTPIVILEGSFGGPVIYENKEFISPNQVSSTRSIASLTLFFCMILTILSLSQIRSDLRKSKAGRYNRRTDDIKSRQARERDLGLRSGEGPRQVDELDSRVLFA